MCGTVANHSPREMGAEAVRLLAIETLLVSKVGDEWLDAFANKAMLAIAIVSDTPAFRVQIGGKIDARRMFCLHIIQAAARKPGFG